MKASSLSHVRPLVELRIRSGCMDVPEATKQAVKDLAKELHVSIRRANELFSFWLVRVHPLPRRLVIHHKDGDFRNNSIGNLQATIQ